MVFDMYIKFGLGKVKIEGLFKYVKYMGEVLIFVWLWGVSNIGDLYGGLGVSGGKVNVQDIFIIKYVDSCFNVLFNVVCMGGCIDQVWLYVINVIGEQIDFFMLELSEGILVILYFIGGSGGEDCLIENIILYFGKFKYFFQLQDDKGVKFGGVKDFIYDMQKVVVV